jgi:hypothetical protein
MSAELSEKEVARRLQQASRLRRLCLSLSRASAVGVADTSARETERDENENPPGIKKISLNPAKGNL